MYPSQSQLIRLEKTDKLLKFRYILSLPLNCKNMQKKNELPDLSFSNFKYRVLHYAPVFDKISLVLNLLMNVNVEL